MVKAHGRTRTQNRSEYNITKGTARQRGNTSRMVEGEGKTVMNKQEREVTMRSRGEGKG